MKRTATLLVLAVVVLAGCSGNGGTTTGSPSTTAEPPVTDTERPTPTAETPTAGNGQQFAPGVTRAGITNPVALLRAHQESLLSEGFVINETVTSTYNGSLSNRLVVRTTVGSNGELAYQNGTSTGYDAEGEQAITANAMWLNTTTMVSRHTESGAVTYRIRPRLYPPESLVWFGGLQRDIQFGADEYEVTNVERRDGTRFVTLEASIDRVGGDGVPDTTGRLLVDGNGVIRAAETSVTYSEGVRYNTTYTVVALGQSAPERPEWVATVPPSAALDVGLDVFSFEPTHVELVHTYGDAVPAGSFVTVVSNGTRYETTLPSAFGDGERYLWVAGNGTLRATAESPTAPAATTLGQEVTVMVRAPDGAELFSTSIGRAPGR